MISTTAIARFLLLFVATSTLTMSTCANLHAAVMYEFTVVSDTNMAGVTSLGAIPQINNNDQIAYRAADGGSLAKIMRWDSGVSTQLASGSTISPVVINDAGAIAYELTFSLGYVADDSGTTQLFNNGRGVDIDAINSSGQVLASIKTGNSTYEVVSRTAGGSQMTELSNESNGEYRFFLSGGVPSPDINDSGDVAVRGSLRATNRDGVYVHTDAGLITIADSSGPLQSFGNFVDLNNSGDVGYWGRRDGGVSSDREVYYYDSDTQTSSLIASVGSGFDSITETGVAINNTGGLIFGGSANGTNGIFIGGDPINDRVISVGDTIDGSTVTSLVIRRGGLNDSGNFVFYASLDDDMNGTTDRTAIVFAAVAVPEPTGLLPLVALVAMTTSRRRKSVIEV